MVKFLWLLVLVYLILKATNLKLNNFEYIFLSFLNMYIVCYFEALRINKNII